MPPLIEANDRPLDFAYTGCGNQLSKYQCLKRKRAPIADRLKPARIESRDNCLFKYSRSSGSPLFIRLFANRSIKVPIVKKASTIGSSGLTRINNIVAMQALANDMKLKFFFIRKFAYVTMISNPAKAVMVVSMAVKDQ